MGRGFPVFSVAAKLQKQRQPTDLASNDEHLPTIRPRMQSLLTPDNAVSSISSGKHRPQEIPATPLSRDSISATPIISDSCDSSIAFSFPSFSSSSSAINSPPELISIGTDPCSPLENSFPQPASVTSSAYYSSYSPSHGRTVRVGHDSLLHRSKYLFSLKR